MAKGNDDRFATLPHRGGLELCSLNQAAAILGISRSTAWELNRRGEFPVKVFRIGSSNKVSIVDLEHYVKTGVPLIDHRGARGEKTGDVKEMVNGMNPLAALSLVMKSLKVKAAATRSSR